MGKSIIIILMGFLTIFSISIKNINDTVAVAVISQYESFSRVSAKDVADSGVNLILHTLINNPEWRGTKANVSFGGGTFTAGAVNDSKFSPGGIRIFSDSDFNGEIDSVRVYVIFNTMFPTAVRAGVTSNTAIAVAGTIIIDGREHDSNGNLIPDDIEDPLQSTQGTLGISTTSTYTHHGNAKVGGADPDDVDGDDVLGYRPSKPGQTAIIEEGYAWPGGFPDTPDKVMGGIAAGFPEGTLRRISKSGLQGSQYATNPSSLNFPLRGVTYVEMGSGQTWQSMDFGNSSGILVVHNAWTNSIIKNLNSGTFKGLIIADDIDKVHTTIIGGIVVLTQNPPAGNVIGNGSGKILYSSEALGTVSTGLPGVTDAFSIQGWIY